MATATRTGRTFTISFPTELADQVERLAVHEGRTTSELFREAFRSYRAVQVRKALQELNESGARNNHMGYTPEDVERFVDEVRAEIHAEKRAAKD